MRGHWNNSTYEEMLRYRYSFDWYIDKYINNEIEEFESVNYGICVRYKNNILNINVFKKDNFPDNLDDYNIEKLDLLPGIIIKTLEDLIEKINIKLLDTDCKEISRKLIEPKKEKDLTYSYEIKYEIDEDTVNAMKVLYIMEHPGVGNR